MSNEEYMNVLNDDIVKRFKTAIELGKWPDGRELTDDQRETCIQAVIMYEHEHLSEDERTGYVPPKETSCDSSKEQETPVKWK